MEQFPLYEQLLLETRKKGALSAKHKQHIITMIGDMDNFDKELLFMIIHVYSQKSTTWEKPNGIDFDLQKFPNELVQIIYTFVQKLEPKYKTISTQK